MDEAQSISESGTLQQRACCLLVEQYSFIDLFTNDSRKLLWMNLTSSKVCYSYCVRTCCDDHSGGVWRISCNIASRFRIWNGLEVIHQHRYMSPPIGGILCRKVIAVLILLQGHVQLASYQ